MNIFVLDRDPALAARMQCDQHVVKMTLEAAQLLCSQFPTGHAPYRQTHYNHPCSRWVRASRSNYSWLLEHGRALAEEFEFRRKKTHASKRIIEWCKENIGAITFCGEERTPFVLCMPEIYKTDDPIESYRRFYCYDKARFALWRWGREKPNWYRKEA